MASPTGCAQIRERIWSFLDGDLFPREERSMADHLASCQACAMEVERCRGLLGLLGEVAHHSVEVGSDPAFLEALHRRIEGKKGALPSAALPSAAPPLAAPPLAGSARSSRSSRSPRSPGSSTISMPVWLERILGWGTAIRWGLARAAAAAAFLLLLAGGYLFWGPSRDEQARMKAYLDLCYQEHLNGTAVWNYTAQYSFPDLLLTDLESERQ